MAATKTLRNLANLFRRRTDRKLAITVLAGGPSGEREVSLQSGRAVADALRAAGHTVYLEDIAPDNLSALARNVDCVFIALHGTFGEDGQVQQILERREITYTGTAPDGCSLAMDKVRAKERFSELDLPTPRYGVATPDNLRAAMAAWSLPVVVKPVSEGSSLACFLVKDFSQFRPAVDTVIDKYGRCLIEDYIAGREITIGIFGDEALPPIEIRTRRAFYDYQAKYVDEDTEYVFDIDLPDGLLREMAAMSVEAHRGLGCRDFSRVDWRVDGDHRPWLLEVNVIPGLTSHSLVPKMAARSGMNMTQLCETLVDMAMKRRSAR